MFTFASFQELRRRRTEVTVDLRKQKKDDMLSKRRNVCLDSEDEPTSPLQDKSNIGGNQMPTIESIKAGIFSNNVQEAFKATQVRKQLKQVISTKPALVVF